MSAETESVAPPAPRRRERRGFGKFAQDFAESPMAMVGLVLCVVIVLAAVFAPWITPQDPYDLASLDLMDSRLRPGEVGMTGTVHVLGTDGQGRDLFSAILYGLRISLGVGVVAGAIAMLLEQAWG
jgi:peptide/nickel transport system permease protein